VTNSELRRDCLHPRRALSRVTVALTAPTGGTLATGAQLPAGSRLGLALDWPANFPDGTPQVVTIEGRQVHVVFEKIGDI